MTEYIEQLKFLPEPKRTFMEIMKVHKSEVHIANLLAFFFRSNEQHNLGKLFIESYLQTKCYDLNLEDTESKGNLISQVIPNVDDQKVFLNSILKAEVKNEDPTDKTDQKKKRIDILITTETSVLCIEFKVNHDLNNPLDIYQNQVEIKYGSKNYKFYSVLTPFKKKPFENVQKFIEGDKSKFTQTILSHFIKNVLQNIPQNYFIENINNPYAQNLADFIQTIQNREIRFKRSEILKDLNYYCIESNLNSEYFSRGGNGGFIQIKFPEYKFKIRIINNQQFSIEKWSNDNVKTSECSLLELSNLNQYELVTQELNTLRESHKV